MNSKPTLSDATQAAMYCAYEGANKSLGKRKGFGCIIGHVEKPRLLLQFRDYLGPVFGPPVPILSAIARHIHETAGLEALLPPVLEAAATSDTEPEIASLAKALIQAIERDRVEGARVRKPFMYAAPSETGLAISVAIDGRFWNRNLWVSLGR